MKYTIIYKNENKFRKKERALKKYHMLAYKKLIFDYYGEFIEGIFGGVIATEDMNEQTKSYELKLPTDEFFLKEYGEIILHYTVCDNEKTVVLDDITPDTIENNFEIKKKTFENREDYCINLLGMLGKKN